MASSFHLLALCSLLLISATLAQVAKPKALLLQVTKDPKTLQYLTHIKQRTPHVSLLLTLDLGGNYLWTDCASSYVSSTYRYYSCHSPQCKLTATLATCTTCDSPPEGMSCHNNSCREFPENSVTRNLIAGELNSDVISVRSTNGKNPTGFISVPQFLFLCTGKFLLDGLPRGVKGMAGLGRSQLSLPSQFAKFFNFRRIFALCLSPSTKGVVFFGDGPYVFSPNVDVLPSLIHTPLIVNRGSKLTGLPAQYFIGVTSIKINGKIVPINTTLLSFDNESNGATTISTVNPYTVLEESIYDAVVNAFVKAMPNVTRAAPVAPFEVCYKSSGIASTRVGPAVPVIDLVLQSEKVFWRIFGSNSMVRMNKDVMCLAFVKKGLIFPWHAITIGGHQLENNLLQFNVAKSRLGFSSTLLARQTTCANFNFTSTM